MKKHILGIVAASTLFGCTLPVYAQSNSNDEVSESTKLSIDSSQVSEQEIDKAKEIVNIINELDQNLDMYNLSNNSQSDIEKLDKDAQEFYNLYKQAIEQNDGKVTQEETIGFLNSASSGDTNVSTTSAMKLPSLGEVKKYNLSNKEVNDIVKLAGVHGSGWALITALAGRFAKKPTLLTILIIGVPALGAATINACNSNNKGVVIQDIRIGATHSFSCYAR